MKVCRFTVISFSSSSSSSSTFYIFFLSIFILKPKDDLSDIRVFASPRLQAHRFNVLSSVYLAATNDHSPWRGGCLVPNYHLVKYALIHTLHTGRVCMQLPRATLPFFLLNDFVRRLYKHVIVVNLELHWLHPYRSARKQTQSHESSVEVSEHKQWFTLSGVNVCVSAVCECLTPSSCQDLWLLSSAPAGGSCLWRPYCLHRCGQCSVDTRARNRGEAGYHRPALPLPPPQDSFICN